MGVPVVDDDGQVQVPGQLHLGGEKVPLLLPSLRVFHPVVIQADLANGLYLGMGRHGPDLVQGVQFHALQILRVESHRGVEEIIALRQRHRHPGAGQITARVEHQPHALVLQTGQHLVPVGVKGGSVIVCMGIKQHGYALLPIFLIIQCFYYKCNFFCARTR